MSGTNKTLNYAASLGVPSVQDTLSIPLNFTESIGESTKPLTKGDTGWMEQFQPDVFEKIIGGAYDKTQNLLDYILPPIAKDIYNESIQGLSMQIATGKPRYDTLRASGVPQSWFREIAVQVGSLVGSPTDIALTAGSYGMGNLALKGALKSTIKLGAEKMLKTGVINKQMAANIIKSGYVDTLGGVSTAFAVHDEFKENVWNLTQAINDKNSSYGQYIITGDESKSFGDIFYGEGSVVGKIDLEQFDSESSKGTFDKYMAALNIARQDFNLLKTTKDVVHFGAALPLGRFLGKYAPRPKLLGGSGWKTPLKTSFGNIQAVGGEAALLTATHSIVDRGEGPNMYEGLTASGIVLAAMLPRFLKNRSIQLSKRYRGAWYEKGTKTWIYPKDYKGPGKIPTTIENAEVVLDPKLLRPGTLAELSRPQLEKVIYKSAADEAISRRITDVWSMVQNPIASAENAWIDTGAKAGVSIFEKQKDGTVKLIGNDEAQTELTIKRLNKDALPGGMATGDYMDTSIIGTLLRANANPKSSPKNIEELIGTQKLEIPKAVDVKIVPDSFRYTDTGISFNINSGREIYALDEKNTDLFLKFYTSQPGLKDRFLKNNKGILKDNFAMTRIRRRTLTSLISDGKNSKHNLQPLDYKNALTALALEYPKFEKLIKGAKDPSKPILVKDMSDAEMLLVTQRMQDAQTSRRWIKYVRENFNSELRFVNPNSNQNEIFNIFSSVLSEVGSIITAPAGRTLLGMLSKADGIIRQRSTEDIFLLQQALGMDITVLGMKKKLPTMIQKAIGYNPFRNKLAEQWIMGEKDIILSNGELIGTGFSNYQLLDLSGKGKSIFAKWKKQAARINNNPKKSGLTQPEIDFLNWRVKTIPKIKILMDDIVNRGIFDANLRIPGKKEFYMPYVMDKGFRDTIYSQMLTLNEKVERIIGVKNAIQTDPALVSLTEKQQEEVSLQIHEWIKGLQDSADPFKQGVAIAWKEARSQIEKHPSTHGRVPELEVRMAMNASLFNEGFKTYGHLEKKRTLGHSSTSPEIDIMSAVGRKKSQLLTKNLLTLFTDYSMGANKRIAMSQIFGPEGKLYYNLLNMIPDDASFKGLVPDAFRAVGVSMEDRAAQRTGQIPNMIGKQKDILKLYMDLLSGESQYSRSTPWAKFQEPFANLIFTTKISMGTATIPNAFQLFISTLVDLGLFSTISGGKNYFVNPLVTDMVNKSGAPSLTLIDELLPGVRALRISSEKLIDVGPSQGVISDWLKEKNIQNLSQILGQPFMYVNLANKIVSAAAAEDYIIKITKQLSGKGSWFDRGIVQIELPTVIGKEALDSYFRNKSSYKFGLNPDILIKNSDAIINRIYKTPEELKVKRLIMQAIDGFAQRSQMGRDLTLDTLSVNDPNSRTVSLFKRWAKRQVNYWDDMLSFEMKNGNYMIPLTIAGSAIFGGWMVLRVKDTLLDAIAGGYVDEKTGEWKYNRNAQFIGRAPRFFEPRYDKDTGALTTRFAKGDLREKSYWKDGDQVFDDVKAAFVSSGMIGMAGDIILDDEPLQSVKFAMQPAIAGDIERISKTLYYLLIDHPSDPGSDYNIAARKAVDHFSPSMGSLLHHNFKRWNYEPWPVVAKVTGGEKFEKVPVQIELNKLRKQKALLVEEIRNIAIRGPELGYGDARSASVEIRRLMTEWNESVNVSKKYPGLMIVLDDYSNRKIMEKFVDIINENKEKYELKDTDLIPSDILR